MRNCNQFLHTFEVDEEVLALHIDFLITKAWIPLDGCFTKSGIRGMLERRDFLSLDKGFLFVAALIDRSTGNKTIARMISVPTYYTEIVSEGKKKVGKRIWTKEKQKRLLEKIKVFKMLLVQTFR